MSKVKMKVIFTFEYEADPAHYGTDDPAEMANIDQSSYCNDLDAIYSLLDTQKPQVEVQVVEPGAPK